MSHDDGGCGEEPDSGITAQTCFRCLSACWSHRVLQSSSTQPSLQQNTLNIHIYIQGVEQTLSSEATYNKYVCEKKEKQQHIAVGTARTFVEPSCQVVTLVRLTRSTYATKIAMDTTLHNAQNCF